MHHALLDKRSLAFANVIAGRVEADPTLLDSALANIERWLVTSSPGARPALLEWQHIIKSGMAETLSTLRGEDERCVRLRQSSPFAGEEFITRAERTAIILQFATRKNP